MARQTKKTNDNNYNFELTNTVVLRGVVRKILLESDKVVKYSIDVPSETPNGNIAHAFVNVTEFTSDGAIKEGTAVAIEGYISTGSYTKKDGTKAYTTDIVVKDMAEI